METKKNFLYLEDLQIGERFASASHTLDEGQIKDFAKQFDPQPFHLDPELARGSFFGGLVASGWHTASLTMKLLVTGEMQLTGGVIGVGGDVAWPNPTRAGDTLHVKSEIVAIVPSKTRSDRGIVTVYSETLNQRGEIVQKLTAKLIVFRSTNSGA
jgi:acyl dehydratase